MGTKFGTDNVSQKMDPNDFGVDKLRKKKKS